MPRKVTPEVLEEMRKLRGKGLTYQEIAGKTCLSLPTVANYVKKEGLRGRKVTGEVLERMRELKGEGLTYKEIAGRLGLSVTTVCSHLKKEEKVGLVEEKEEKVEEKVGLVERLKRALGVK